ncbi:unnamed protein product [Closterium sp. Naga37s-1]|nr:unnamed protein product [Closterium sp. Naga37s-1]
MQSACGAQCQRRYASSLSPASLAQERTYTIRKAHVNVDKALKAAEVVLEKYDVARQVEGCIKEGPKADLEPYLAAIARLQEAVAYFEAHRSFKSAEAALAHSKALLRDAHHRLADALRQHLLQFTKEPDPAKLWDASKQGEEEAGRQGEKEAGGEGKMEGGGLPVLLADGRAGDRIRQLAEALIRIGRGDKCLKTYTEVRGAMVEAGLRRNGMERLTREQMECMVWGELEELIGAWKHISLLVPLVLRAERELCETVLAGLQPHTGKAFADLAGPTLGMLFGFGEVVAQQRKAVKDAKELMNMFEKLLIMYHTMWTLVPQVEVMCAGPACESIRGSAQQLLQHLAAAAKEAFYSFERAVESDESMHSERLSVAPDGMRHMLTSFVFNFLNYLHDDYQPTMQVLFGAGSDSLLSDAVKRVFAALYSNMERRSRQYGDAALAQFFLMNNTHYVVEGVHRGGLKEVVGAEWIYRQRRIVQQHAAAYRRTSWNTVIGLLSSAGLAEDGKEGSVSRSVLKERFRVFNATFEELHRAQCVWKIPDQFEELRCALQLQIAELLLPAYRSFVERYTPVLRNGGVFGRSSEAASKYIRFTVEALDLLLHEFFRGRESRNILLTQPSAAC